MSHNLSSKIRPVIAWAPAVAGTGDTLFSNVIDLGTDGGALCMVELGAVTAGATLVLEALGGETSGDCIHVLEGKAEVDPTQDNANKILFLDCHRLTEKFVRFRLTRGVANAEVVSGVVCRYQPARESASLPVIPNAEVAGGAILASPDDTGATDQP